MSSYLLEEDNASKFILETAAGDILLEGGVAFGPTIIEKTGTAGSPVMQKAGSGWTYVTGKTGTVATAICQKTLAGWTKVTGH